MFGVMPLAWIGLCIAFWFTGVSLIPIESGDEALTYFGPLWLDRLFQGWLVGGRQLLFASDAVWVLLAPLWIKQTFLAVRGSKVRFNVTDRAAASRWCFSGQHAAQRRIRLCDPSGHRAAVGSAEAPRFGQVSDDRGRDGDLAGQAGRLDLS
jgi:hypothetical protein